jgi:hypothetical protein
MPRSLGPASAQAPRCSSTCFSVSSLSTPYLSLHLSLSLKKFSFFGVQRRVYFFS